MKRDWINRSSAGMAMLLWLVVLTPSPARADVELYNDGAWIVNGIDDAAQGPDRITISVGGQVAGSFTELQIFRSFSGGFPMVFSFKAGGALTPIVPPSGDAGGAFHLTGYWDCYAGAPVELKITSLDLQPNQGNFNSLDFTGALSNGSTLQSSDLRLELQLPDKDTVNLDVRYTLMAMTDLCVDQWRQEFKEGFQVARITSNYISSQVNNNDGARVKAIVGKWCDCCDCGKIVGSICSIFVNDAGYLFQDKVRMAAPPLLMVHSQPGPRNTASLKIVTKKPKYSNAGAQGYIEFTNDPSVENVSLWVNWDKAKKNYKTGKKVGAFQFNLVAELPESFNCDYISP